MVYAPAAGVILPVGAQTLNVTFTPTDAAHYSTTQKSVTLTVNKVAATVTLAGLSQMYNGQPRPVTVTTVPAGLKVNTTYNGSPNPPTGVGSYTVVATVNDPNATGAKTGTLVIAKGNQTITFAALPAMSVGAADYVLTASASSGLPVSYASSVLAVATIEGGKLHIVGAGTTLITASQGGNENWKAATAVKQTLTVRNADQDIRAFYAEMKRRIEAHDESGFFALFAPDYIHQGLDVADQFVDGLDNAKSFTFNITSIASTGNEARVSGSFTLSFKKGEPAVTWSEPDTTDQSPGIGWLRKTPAGWQVAGDQQRAHVSVHTGHRITPAGDPYFVLLTAESSLAITRVRASGPGTGTIELQPDPARAIFAASVGDFTGLNRPAVGTVYTFVIDFADGSQTTYQGSVKSWVATGPVVSVTTGARTAAVHWTKVGAAVGNAGNYWVRVSGPGVYWESEDLPLNRTTAVFNSNSQAGGTLQSGRTYLAEVFIFNTSGDFAYQQCEFTMR